MEIRQVLKSSASMIPDLFYKVSDETRGMEKSRDGGGKGRKERRMSRGGRRKRNVRAGGGRVEKTHTFGEKGGAGKAGREGG